MEDEFNECEDESNKSKRMEEELRKDSLKGCEINDNLSLRMKSNYSKEGRDDQQRNLKLNNSEIFPFYENQ